MIWGQYLVVCLVQKVLTFWIIEKIRMLEVKFQSWIHCYKDKDLVFVIFVYKLCKVKKNKTFLCQMACAKQDKLDKSVQKLFYKQKVVA